MAVEMRVIASVKTFFEKCCMTMIYMGRQREHHYIEYIQYWISISCLLLYPLRSYWDTRPTQPLQSFYFCCNTSFLMHSLRFHFPFLWNRIRVYYSSIFEAASRREQVRYHSSWSLAVIIRYGWWQQRRGSQLKQRYLIFWYWMAMIAIDYY